MNGDIEAGVKFFGDVRGGFDDGSGDFVAGNAGVADERVFAAKGAEVCPAKADEAGFQENFAGGGTRLGG